MVVALFTVQVAVITICTVMVEVDVAAEIGSPEATSEQAASAMAQPWNFAFNGMTFPTEIRQKNNSPESFN